ncbi:MAG: FecR domain-containing protein, partial [Anaerotignum sp.]|nr:FecR domain-containing protein [Anaerotignum sp.]
MRMKKFLTFLLTIAMVVSLLPATAFAANHTATTMRLAKTQGTVTVTNATGKKVTQTSNMKLYNGYKLKTGAKSYAWISLDDTKVAKLDASSVVSVQKSGQKLTLYLSSGNIFFNVKEPMKSGESLHIKTSTMTTGIRGTSGCVRVINPRVSEIHLLTGRIEVFAEHPELHLTKSEVLTAGNMATSLIDREAMQLTGEQVEIIVEELQEQNVCGNCATEVAADPELQERIEEETDMDVEEIVNDAEEKLAEDELAAAEEQAAIDQAEAEQQEPEDVDPYFEETSSGGGGGGSSSTPAVSTEVNVSTWIQLYNALTQYNEGSGIKRINLQDENGNGVEITGVGETTTLPAIQNKGELTLYLGESKLTLNDTLVNKGNLIIDNAQGILTGDITAFEENDYTYPNLIRNTGTLTQKNGTLYMPQDFGACIAVYNDGTFNMEGGTIENASGWGVHAVENDNDAVFNLSGGTINFSGEDSSAVYNTGSMIMDDGTINLYDGAWAIDNVYAGTLTMSGGIINAGDTGTVGINSVWEEGSLNLSENAVIKVTGAEALGIEAQTNLTITGGTINVSGASAVGVDIYGGAVTMKGGTIQTSKNTNDTGAGTGIRIIDGIFTMNNGSITG